MRKAIVYLLIFLLLLAAPTALRYLKFYQLGGPERADPPPFNPENITQVPTPPATEHVDEPEVGEGLVLLDQAHKNNFELAEIAHLDGRLAARGFELQPYEGGDLGTALRAANALVVISPLESYVDEEIRAVVDFVRRGGRLLLIGDPTRFNVAFDEEDEFNFEILLETDEIPLNSLANQFDLIFVGDYLYNTLENEGNFRNIILDEIGDEEDQLLEGLDRLVFYSSHSVQVGPEGESLIDADDNTWSSATDRPGGLALAAASHNRQVLAVGDVHFLMDPYYTVYDNGRFIANIADFLVRTSDRQYVLADFPYFFDDDVDLIYTGSPELGPDAFDEIIIMQDAFRGIAKNLELVAESRAGHDTLYLGLYNQSEQLVEVLASHGISLTIEPPVLTAAEIRALEDASEGGEEGEEDSAGADEEEQQTEANGPDDGETAEEDEVEIKQLIHSSLGSIQMSGTALIIFEDGGQEQNVVALAASKEGLEQAIGRLLDLVPADGDYALSDCLLQDNLAFCPTNVPDEEVEAELLTGGVPAPPEEPEEEGDDDSDEGDGEEDEGDDEDVIAEELDAAQQGVIQLGETVQGALEEDESHSWIFDGGPATIDIVLGSAELDTVLELYGPDNELIDSADGGFSGDDEVLFGIDIPDSSDYSILVRDFFGDSGAYTLTVTLAEDVGELGNEILIFGDDDGVPISSGFTNIDAIAGQLSETYAVTTWSATQDGPLEDDALQGYELVIWDSGDYRDEEGVASEDSFTILNYVGGGGDLLIVGASPTLFGSLELSQLADVAVIGDDPILTSSFSDGEIIELDQTIDAVVLDSTDVEDDENSVAFLARGPASADSGNLVGVATLDDSLGDQRTAILLTPFTALPTTVQSTVLLNLVAWFGLSGS